MRTGSETCTIQIERFCSFWKTPHRSSFRHRLLDGCCTESATASQFAHATTLKIVQENNWSSIKSNKLFEDSTHSMNNWLWFQEQVFNFKIENFVIGGNCHCVPSWRPCVCGNRCGCNVCNWQRSHACEHILNLHSKRSSQQNEQTWIAVAEVSNCHSQGFKLMAINLCRGWLARGHTPIYMLWFSDFMTRSFVMSNCCYCCWWPNGTL